MIPDNILQFLHQSNLIEGIDIPEAYLETYWERPDERPITKLEQHAKNSCLALHQVMNYTLHETPMSKGIINDLHFLQMDGLLPPSDCGHVRKEWVKVGGDICPDPAHLPKLLTKFIKHFNNKKLNSPEWLHFEFECIHPFIDGNGRTGRLLYAYDLLRRGKEIRPILSRFGGSGAGFQKRRQDYYNAIRAHKTAYFIQWQVVPNALS